LNCTLFSNHLKMIKICASAIESTDQFDPKNNTSARVYSFKKRKPLPGAYPKNFSPYLLNNISTTRAVPLPPSEIRNDLNLIQQAITKEFSSRYFDEVHSAQDIEPQVNVPCQDNAPCEKASHPQRFQRRIPRKSNLSSFQAPMTEAEERRQLRAAMKASQLEAARPNDLEHLELRMLNENLSISTKQEAVSAARLLRAPQRSQVDNHSLQVLRLRA
jgi:hypothetical protein